MPEQNLYEMLGVEKTASQADIKKAYYKLALQWHPDRNPEPEATAKFQALQRIYDVLGDPVKRQLYDNTGSLQDCEDMVQGGNFTELYAAFREATKVTEEDLESFSVKYRGSSEERTDLLHWYTRFKGDMVQVFDWLMLSRPDVDSHRFRDMLEQAIAEKEIKSTKAYKQWSAVVAAAPPPTADPLAPPKSSKKGKKQQGSAGDSMALVAAIKNKKSSAFNGMLASLEAKYAQPAKAKSQQSTSKAAAAGARTGKTGRKQKKASSSSGEGDADNDANIEEPTEEEFAAARARIEARAVASSKAGQAKKQKSAAGSQITKEGSAIAAAKPLKRQKKA